MRKENITLSSYVVTWAEFFPKSGLVTVHDQKAFGALIVFRGKKSYRTCFPSIDSARDFVRNFNKRLDTEYTVLFSTDKQFGMAEAPDYEIPYTDYQKSHVETIGKQYSVDHLFSEAYDRLDLNYIRSLLRNNTRQERLNFLVEQVESCAGLNQLPSRIKKGAEMLYWKIF